ncbi:MAG: shikimate dehydrogenase family protein [Candidatus Cyclobacteriaceae bacterium M2_1C_046]
MSIVYGLIGKKLSHSFSKKYFTDKFKREGLDNHKYELFELPSVDHFPGLIRSNAAIKGLNVTIPYKTAVIPYLTVLDDAAKNIGAVNTIKIKDQRLIGFNTDAFGFERSLLEKISINNISSALILGTGGASKAVQYVMEKIKLPYQLVSRINSGSTISYAELHADHLVKESTLIINTTPLGMFPNLEEKPDIPYHEITKNHILFDLVYNPERTAFLEEGLKRGATAINGLDMLYYQADRAWEIWNNPDYEF